MTRRNRGSRGGSWLLTYHQSYRHEPVVGTRLSTHCVWPSAHTPGGLPVTGPPTTVFFGLAVGDKRSCHRLLWKYWAFKGKEQKEAGGEKSSPTLLVAAAALDRYSTEILGFEVGVRSFGDQVLRDAGSQRLGIPFHRLRLVESEVGTLGPIYVG